jgi:hypothetical protein
MVLKNLNEGRIDKEEENGDGFNIPMIINRSKVFN